ncbi:hypothetical protein CP970_15930 [Streptomyces kanamyceticus]|uniref:Uncharacterized protein n=1 Tax=Streptomyces kanamyceticus TaxID=1967 RepID=A0A5J6GEC5_STRKN|nr:hypothetical protein [Streptomyces kanamyceticus]QEU92195.1 hypothetical protein CP970_15930 [Streptomyces kanamyceticus]
MDEGAAVAVLLYYPLVNPPTEVVHQALLYWDGLASVVPLDPEIREAAIAPPLQALEQRQLYTPLTMPRQLIDEEPDDGPPPSRQLREVLGEELRSFARERPLPGPVPHEAFLLPSKTEAWLEAELTESRLAERLPGGRGLAMTREVQELVVGMLAREIAWRRRDRHLFPYTERVDAQRRALRPAPNNRGLAWEMELGQLLPVPAVAASLNDVLAFREKYADERRRLMRALHRLLGDLRRDYEHPADVVAQLRVELDEAVADYRSAARDSRIVWVHRSVTATVGLAAAAVGSQLLPGLDWCLGVVGGFALNVATREIRPVTRRRQDHDFSYLHRVHTTLR